MSREGSERLLNAQYLSSDISFKRINDFYEFEIACIDRISNTSEDSFSQLCSALTAYTRCDILSSIPHTSDCDCPPTYL